MLMLNLSIVYKILTNIHTEFHRWISSRQGKFAKNFVSVTIWYHVAYEYTSEIGRELV